MDFNAIIKRVVAILTKPKEEWEVIKNEQMSVSDMYTKYAIIVAAIPAICGFIGWVAVGRSFMSITIKMPIGRALIWAVFQYALALGAVYVVALIIDALAPSFGAQKDFNRSLKITIFSYTAAWVGGVFYLIPALSIIAALAAIYSLVLLYSGMASLKEPPKDKLMGYFVTVIIVEIVLFFIIGAIIATVAFGAGASRLMF
ncbi:MAG: DUF1282 domain-containing protein [bacterium]|nr:DUF1282 domain-containing protein [bacterium]